MHGFLVLFKKELRQQRRTHRLLIVVVLFVFFGLGTPLLLNYLPELVPGEEQIVIPEFTAVDAVQGYIDNFGQVGLLAAILVAMGAVARERESGTAAMTLSKPLGSGAFLTAKLAAMTVTFAAGMVAGGLGCYVYTVIIFGDPGALDFLAANLVAWLYLVFCLAVTLMFSSFFRNHLAAGGLALLFLVVLAATSGLRVMEDYSPGALLSWSTAIASGSAVNRWGILAVSLALIPLTVVAGWRVFRRKEL